MSDPSSSIVTEGLKETSSSPIAHEVFVSRMAAFQAFPSCSLSEGAAAIAASSNLLPVISKNGESTPTVVSRCCGRVLKLATSTSDESSLKVTVAKLHGNCCAWRSGPSYFVDSSLLAGFVNTPYLPRKGLGGGMCANTLSRRFLSLVQFFTTKTDDAGLEYSGEVSKVKDALLAGAARIGSSCESTPDDVIEKATKALLCGVVPILFNPIDVKGAGEGAVAIDAQRWDGAADVKDKSMLVLRCSSSGAAKPSETSMWAKCMKLGTTEAAVLAVLEDCQARQENPGAPVPAALPSASFSSWSPASAALDAAQPLWHTSATPASPVAAPAVSRKGTGLVTVTGDCRVGPATSTAYGSRQSAVAAYARFRAALVGSKRGRDGTESQEAAGGEEAAEEQHSAAEVASEYLSGFAPEGENLPKRSARKENDSSAVSSHLSSSPLETRAFRTVRDALCPEDAEAESVPTAGFASRTDRLEIARNAVHRLVLNIKAAKAPSSRPAQQQPQKRPTPAKGAAPTAPAHSPGKKKGTQPRPGNPQQPRQQNQQQQQQQQQTQPASGGPPLTQQEKLRQLQQERQMKRQGTQQATQGVLQPPAGGLLPTPGARGGANPNAAGGKGQPNNNNNKQPGNKGFHNNQQQQGGNKGGQQQQQQGFKKGGQQQQGQQGKGKQQGGNNPNAEQLGRETPPAGGGKGGKGNWNRRNKGGNRH